VALAAVDVAAVVVTNRGVVSIVHVEVGHTHSLLIVNNGGYSEPLSLSLVTHTRT
jgi:hypothetical protein